MMSDVFSVDFDELMKHVSALAMTVPPVLGAWISIEKLKHRNWPPKDEAPSLKPEKKDKKKNRKGNGQQRKMTRNRRVRG
jgi:hypothetical protein